MVCGTRLGGTKVVVEVTSDRGATENGTLEDTDTVASVVDVEGDVSVE
jgi:hypothetical protein